MIGDKIATAQWPAVVTLLDETRQVVIADRVYLARSLWARFRGLMGRTRLDDTEGLLIDPCSAIHTLWMRFPIDVLYVGRDHVVRHIDHGLRPWRIGALRTGAAYVVELNAGVAERAGVHVGDRVGWRWPKT